MNKKGEKGKNMKNKGITLIALVITIIVLLILAGVSIATLTGQNGILTRANDAKEKTEEATAQEKVEVEKGGSFDTSGKLKLDLLKSNIQNEGGSVEGDSFPAVVIMDGYKFLVSSTGEVKLIGKITEVGDTNLLGEANAPKLSDGMIPIKWNGNNWVICSKDDPEWYNYIDQTSGTDGTSKWANIMLSDGRYKAETAQEGQVVQESELGSMFVWIPRYAYSIENLYHTNSEDSGGEIKIAFLTSTLKYNSGDTIIYSYQGTEGTAQLTNASGQGNWNEHPAFNYGEKILSGIWVAKFETSSTTETPDTNYGGGDVTDLNIKVLPGKQSWRNITVSNIFTNCINMNSSENASYYGISSNDNIIDPHLIKNSEWGAVAYFTQSSYGRNGNQVTPNSNGWGTYKYTYTGYAGNGTLASNPDYGATQPTNVYYYNTSEGMLASTTGNITGIYDMSGGSWEYVAGFVDNGHTNLNDGLTLIEAAGEYKNVYKAITEDGSLATSGNDNGAKNYEAMKDIFGDAVYETSKTESGSASWLGDGSGCPYFSYPFFIRGGAHYNGGTAGLFCHGCSTGEGRISNSFRPVIATL